MRHIKAALLSAAVCVLLCQPVTVAAKRAATRRGGLIAILGTGEPEAWELAIALAKRNDYLIYVQLPDADDVQTACWAADEAGFYGTRIFVGQGQLGNIHLADNIADVLIAVGSAAAAVPKAEALPHDQAGCRRCRRLEPPLSRSG